MVRPEKGVIRPKILVRLFSGALGLLLSVLASCATVPPTGQSPAYPAGYLRPSSLWGRLNFDPSPRLKAALAKNESLKDVVSRAHTLWFSLNLEGLHPQSWRLIAQGDYPKALVGLVLDTKPHWVQEKSPVPQWYDQKAGLWVILPEDSLVAAASKPFTPELSQWSPVVFRQVPWQTVHGTGLYLEAEHPAELLFGAKGARLFPIEKLILRLQGGKNAWNGPVELRLKDARAAEGTLFLLKLWSASQRLTPNAKNPLMSSFSNLTWKVQGNLVIGEGLTIPYTVMEQLVNHLMAKKGTP
ncbi:MAG: hypothetical protein HKM05_07990 [Spirochaetales bacterium]|nr:hypothetical protein [Spirochaetales bacterium]